MDLRYAVRRLLYALVVAGVLNALLTGLFCPVDASTTRSFGHCSIDLPAIAFVPVWALHGRPPLLEWVGLQTGISLLIGAAVWFVWPQFRPPPPKP